MARVKEGFWWPLHRMILQGKTDKQILERFSDVDPEYVKRNIKYLRKELYNKWTNNTPRRK